MIVSRPFRNNRPAAQIAMTTTTVTAPRSAPLTHAQAYGLLALVVFVWGANWPTMKMGLHHITPLWFAAARFWMGSLCLFALLAVQGRLALPSRRDLPARFSGMLPETSRLPAASPRSNCAKSRSMAG